jgi:hypothetical protein
VTAADLAASFAQVAPTAKAYNVEIDELAAGYASLTAQGVPAAEAATQMNSAIVALVRTTGPLEKLQEQTGRNYLAIAGDQGLATAYQQLRKDADAAGVPLIDLLGRIEAQNFAFAVTGENAALYAQNLDQVRNASGTAAAQMSERQQGLNFQLGRLKANFHDAAITIGNEVIPIFADLAKESVDWISGNQDKIQQFAADLAGGIREAVTWARALDWNAIGNTFRAAAGFGQGLLQAFLAMPPWVQTAIVTGWGLNKLTGGAIGSIIGQLGAGLVKGVLGMNAGVVNINAGTVTGVGGGMPAGGRGGRGGVGGAALGVAKFVLGPLAAAAIGAEIAAAVNMPFIRPTMEAEVERVTAVLEGGNVDDMVATLSSIESELATSDVGGQIALIGSRIPIIQDALGKVGPLLEEQRDALIQQLSEMGYNRGQIDFLIRQAERAEAQRETAIRESGSDWERQRGQQLGLNNVLTTAQRQAASDWERQRQQQGAGFASVTAATSGIKVATQLTKDAVVAGTASTGGKLSALLMKKSTVTVNTTVNTAVSIAALISQSQRFTSTTRTSGGSYAT